MCFINFCYTCSHFRFNRGSCFFSFYTVFRTIFSFLFSPSCFLLLLLSCSFLFLFPFFSVSSSSPFLSFNLFFPVFLLFLFLLFFHFPHSFFTFFYPGYLETLNSTIEVAIFNFHSVYLGPEVIVNVVGQRALIIMSRTSIVINTTLQVTGMIAVIMTITLIWQ